jgi:hypothetical protein
VPVPVPVRVPVRVRVPVPRIVSRLDRDRPLLSAAPVGPGG